MVDREPVSDSMIDEELEETFPASDAPGHTVETGIRIAPPPSPRALVVDNAAASRFEVTLDGQVAYLRYERTATALTIVHTEVAHERLFRVQSVGTERVAILPHGARRNLEGPPLIEREEPIVLTWGLLGPGKGVELGVDAVARLRESGTEMRYIVAGEAR